MQSLKRTVSNFLIFCLSAMPIQAQQSEGTAFGFGQPSSGFSIGLGAVAAKTPYDSSFSTRIIPYFRYQSQNLTIGGTEGVSYKFLSDYNLTASIAMKPRMAPYSDGDTDLLTGMKRNSSLDLSVTGTMNIARGTSFIIEAATEVTGEHNGQELDFSVRQFVPGFGTPVFLTAGVKRQNANLASFLYGVEASEEVATRRTYSTGTVLLPYISANTIYGLSDSISLFGNTGLTIYPKKVLNSPIINERTSLNLIGGLAFTF